ncbi:XrtA/PEP-CTERM system histidine kinase PrsK [Sphingomonas alba]|uniref:histidine kinase n=1 Tax=Sphingomonas alba TaxID=2908208 RepID=A0ABT0RP67_9SPHN|nr:XrtA/PEP-CTERM system histidine kinase PrsK [Sphingomonas alba]MCL6684428.1 PEP-CTERM system histidine kinase PrsK [Sphingomonas alba]
MTLTNFWSHAMAAALFLSLIMWRVKIGVRHPAQRLMLAGFALTACWAWLTAIAPASQIPALAETVRNLIWVSVLYRLSSGADGERQHGVRWVYGAIGAVLGMQLVADMMPILLGADAGASVVETATILRITAAAGSLVLVHNVYGQAAPESRAAIGMAMLALVVTWGYDLNLYTLLYLDPQSGRGLLDWRGAVIAMTAPLFALGAGQQDGWKMRLSRAATFQSLSLLAICGYFAVMTILATALRGTGWDWSRALLVLSISAMTLAAMVLLPSPKARAWAKVKLAKHLFEHRYDYRAEWLRFADTVGRSGPQAPPIGERLVKAFADIVDAPGGLLLTIDENGAITEASEWNWQGRPFTPDPQDAARWRELEARPMILDIDAMRDGTSEGGMGLPLPEWLTKDKTAWAGVPLVHNERLVGLVLLAAPGYRRPLDWEDFDLLKTAGRQAASSLAEAHGQQALSQAQRFDEFNRRFAFILHDVKNLVSQLSLVARNAERHADNPEFRADMVATLQSSVGKMNDLLERLAPKAGSRPVNPEAQPLKPILEAAILASNRGREVRLRGNQGLWAIADAEALEQAISHLLRNALDASAEYQPVMIDALADGSETAISVIDEGKGMTPDFVRDQLFQPFASTKDGGFGVGAFEARTLVAAMGGRLTVQSRPGKGSRFTIHLPAPEPVQEPKRKRA